MEINNSAFRSKLSTLINRIINQKN